jgi:hypothetical protein
MLSFGYCIKAFIHSIRDSLGEERVVAVDWFHLPRRERKRLSTVPIAVQVPG